PRTKGRDIKRHDDLLIILGRRFCAYAGSPAPAVFGFAFTSEIYLTTGSAAVSSGITQVNVIICIQKSLSYVSRLTNCFTNGSVLAKLSDRLITKPSPPRAEKLSELKTSAKFFASENALVRFFRTYALTAVFAKNAQTAYSTVYKAPLC
ncbi:MAG: hypothetical protein IK139_08285, partial [Lachnospiraceae bacterium]|nr:hypothetical protein [Lachnospiraceae bacterium]